MAWKWSSLALLADPDTPIGAGASIEGEEERRRSGERQAGPALVCRHQFAHGGEQIELAVAIDIAHRHARLTGCAAAHRREARERLAGVGVNEFLARVN